MKFSTSIRRVGGRVLILSSNSGAMRFQEKRSSESAQVTLQFVPNLMGLEDIKKLRPAVTTRSYDKSLTLGAPLCRYWS
jgi:hypothetical protein